MATTTFVPVETYLRMESEPDCEYVDGQIEERPLPEYDHSTWQTALCCFSAQTGKPGTFGHGPNSVSGFHQPASACPM